HVGVPQDLLAENDQLGTEAILARLGTLGDEPLPLEGREQTVDRALVEDDLATDLGHAHLGGVVAECLEHRDGPPNRLVSRHDAFAALAPLLHPRCRHILSHETLAFLSLLPIRKATMPCPPGGGGFMPSSHHRRDRIAP